MFETDLHSHSLFSSCGLHSIIELLTAAKTRGLKGLAITDHGPFLGRKTTSVFFERLKQPIDGICLFKGMECNFTDEDGSIDIIDKFSDWYDIVLAGFHKFPVRDADPGYYTDIIIKALKRNPSIDILVHPNAPHYVSDFTRIAAAASENGIAVELNNSKLVLGRSSKEQTLELINACKKAECMVAVNSDTHAIHEIGDTAGIVELLIETDFPTELIVNRSFDSTVSWLKSRGKALQNISSPVL